MADPPWQSYPRSTELSFHIQSTSEDRLLSSVKHNIKKEGSEKERSFNNKQEAYLIRVGERDVLELEDGAELLRDAHPYRDQSLSDVQGTQMFRWLRFCPCPPM